MPFSPEQQKAFDDLQNRVAVFRVHKAVYKQDETNETETRTDFIDPFFQALGWDMRNWKGLPPYLQQVRREQGVQDTAVDYNKRPDYSFRNTEGRDIFYIEAKKPSIDIYTDRGPAIQVRNYGWHGKLQVGIVTDFEEFAVYDCRVPVDTLNDHSATARTDYFGFEKYIIQDTFLYLWEYFSYNNVQKGSLERYVKDAKNNFTNKAVPIDDAFLVSLEAWRKDIALAIITNNPNLTLVELNYIVQITLNRIVFLRNCEDRCIDAPETLRRAVYPEGTVDFNYSFERKATLFNPTNAVAKAADGQYYKNLLQVFERADH